MLVDANVWSELTRPRPDAAVVAFLHDNREELYLSTIVMAEVEFGIANAPDPVRRERLIEFADRLLLRCHDRVLAPDFETAAVWGRLKFELRSTGQRIEDIDLLIAAQAIAAGMPLVTRNVSDMARTGARIINPWQP
ncbi:MAG: PIN domain-containing protein [Sphingomonadaceae bacterium]|nr:PIN domain-containing protein [Sphingomonadaceae bacterium]